MAEESTTADVVELQKRLTDAANRRDGDAVMALYAPDGVWGMSPMGMGVYEVELRYAAASVWDEGRVVRLTNYGDIDEARAAAERLAEERG